MNELIKVSESEIGLVSSARDLHGALEVKTDFTTWIKRMINYGFIDGQDYSLIKIGEGSAHNKTDYAITFDMAKEVAMLQKNTKGKEVRQFFIEFEKSHRVIQKPLTLKESILLNLELINKNDQLQLENNKLKPRSEFIDRVFESKSTFTIGEASKLLKLDYGRNTLFNVLKSKEMLFKHTNEPKQEFVDRGYFEVKATSFEVPGHGLKISKQTLVTQKGLAYIAKKLNIIITNHE